MATKPHEQASGSQGSLAASLLVLAIIIALCLGLVVAVLSLQTASLINKALGGADPTAVREGFRRAVLETSIGAFFAAILVIATAARSYTRLHQRHDSARRLLEENASIDALTGLPNRRSMVERLESEIVRAKRTASKFSCVIADIDNLTAINAEFGNKDGDAVLKQTGLVLKERLRSYDLVGRYSGEQFLIILPGGGSSEGLQACERLRSAIEKQLGDRVGLDYLKVTASFGVAAYQEGDETADAIIGRADAALARAKAAGKNRCMA
jgi:diguanylate cyclase (GGDEF)-like protein